MFTIMENVQDLMKSFHEMKERNLKMKTKSKKDIQELIDLKLAGKSYRQIEEITGISKDAVRNAIKELLPTDATEIFKKIEPTS